MAGHREIAAEHRRTGDLASETRYIGHSERDPGSGLGQVLVVGMSMVLALVVEGAAGVAVAVVVVAGGADAGGAAVPAKQSRSSAVDEETIQGRS